MNTESELLQAAVNALQAAFGAARERLGEAHVAGYGVLSNDDGRAFTPVAASSRGIPSEDFLFNPENWDTSPTVEESRRVHALIARLEAQCEDDDRDDNWHDEFRSRVHQVFLRAMEQLQAQEFFERSAASRSAFKMVWVVDSEIPIVRGRAWCKRLNAPETYARFAAWLDGKASA